MAVSGLEIPDLKFIGSLSKIILLVSRTDQKFKII